MQIYSARRLVVQKYRLNPMVTVVNENQADFF